MNKPIKFDPVIIPDSARLVGLNKNGGNIYELDGKLYVISTESATSAEHNWLKPLKVERKAIEKKQHIPINIVEPPSFFTDSTAKKVSQRPVKIPKNVKKTSRVPSKRESPWSYTDYSSLNYSHSYELTGEPCNGQ